MTLVDQGQPLQSPTDDDWAVKYISSFKDGFDGKDRPDEISDQSLITADNIRFDKRQTLSDVGFTKFGGNIRGTPRADFQFFLSTGASFLVLVTNSTVYRWNETVDEWQYIGDGVKSTLVDPVNAGASSFKVSDATGFVVGKYIGITLDDGTQHSAQITAIDVDVLVTDAVINGDAAALSVVVQAVELNGSDSIQVSFAVWAAFDRMYFTNGVDTPKQFSGAEITDVANLPGISFTARVVRVFNDYLIFYHTTEDGVAKPQRVRWSAGGDPVNWPTANFLDLYESEGFITTAEELGPYMIVYKERTIIRQQFVGLLLRTWTFDTMIQAEGTQNVDAVVNLGDTHIFWGNANVYEYRGGYELNPVGDEIFNRVFRSDGDLSPALITRVFSVYVEELDDIFFFYPSTTSGTNNYPMTAARFNASEQAWSFRDFTIPISGFGFFQRDTSTDWAGLVGDWAAQNYFWTSKTLEALAPTLHLLGADEQVYAYSLNTDKDDGQDIVYELETKEFTAPGYVLRTNMFEFTMRGNSVKVEVSIDSGNNWVELDTISPGNRFQRIRLWRQFVAERIRIRFSGQDGFGIENLLFTYRLESVT